MGVNALQGGHHDAEKYSKTNCLSATMDFVGLVFPTSIKRLLPTRSSRVGSHGIGRIRAHGDVRWSVFLSPSWNPRLIIYDILDQGKIYVCTLTYSLADLSRSVMYADNEIPMHPAARSAFYCVLRRNSDIGLAKRRGKLSNPFAGFHRILHDFNATGYFMLHFCGSVCHILRCSTVGNSHHCQ